MENKLKSLFEYQRFAQNERLAAIIAESEEANSAELSDDMLEYVSAAGVMSRLIREEDEPCRQKN